MNPSNDSEQQSSSSELTLTLGPPLGIIITAVQLHFHEFQ